MDFNEYQKEASKFAIYPNVGSNYDYPLKGLFSEVGEIADKFKKIERDKNNIVTDGDKYEIAKEVGDSVWYLSQLTRELGYSFNEIAHINLDKLRNRAATDKLKGSGDNR